MTRTIAVSHLARVEGHGGISVTLEGDRITDVQFNIFEGIRLFEGLVLGRSCVDVPGIVSRICAICSHGHAITSLMALEHALGVEVTAQTTRLRDLAYQGANLESHALHFFMLALPDFVGLPGVVALAGVDPEAVKLALRLKKLGNTIQEVIGGRAVHPVNYVIGGFGRLPTLDDLLHLRQELEAGLQDCLSVVSLLQEVRVPDFVHEPIRCAALRPEGDCFFFGQTVQLSDGTDLRSSRPCGALRDEAAQIPVEDYRRLTNERCVPHSHAKHSGFDGRSYMVGALPRLTMNGQMLAGLARTAWKTVGLTLPSDNVLHNNLAQAVEMIYSVEHAMEIVQRLIAQGVEQEAAVRFEVCAGQGTAATEVPRGILFHSYELDGQGRVVGADVITPTAQNFNNAEDQIRATVRDGRGESDDVLRHRLEMVGRAYDPCISCSVHLIRAG